MHFAFRFDQNRLSTHHVWVLEEPVLRSLAQLSRVRSLHVLVSMGLLPSKRFQDGQLVPGLPDQLLGQRAGVWSTLTIEELAQALQMPRLAVATLEGLSIQQATEIGRVLRGQAVENYLGALRVLAADELHWAMYGRLPNMYRVVGDELRVLHTQFAVAADDERDHVQLQHWRESHIFRTVTWENTGVKDSIFDPWYGAEHARTMGELEELLIEQVNEIPNEMLLRAAALDPRLIESLHAALRGYAQRRNAEDLALAAFSCRRFMERLADALFPPREELVGGRDVSAKNYRNRLWAYVKQALPSATEQRLTLATLDDVDQRIKRLVDLANKGIHVSNVSIEDAEMRRLLLGLTTLAFDLLTLMPPPGAQPLGPYERNIADMSRRLLSRTQDAGE